MPESFFDFQSRVSRTPTETDDSRSKRAISVADLTTKIDAALRSGLPVGVLVRGEISNLNHHAASGHLYFTLKDAKSCIDCVMFRGEATRLAAWPADGQDVLVTGNVRVYAQRGRYQLYCQTLTPLGRGVLELKFAELRRRLEAEGLFAADRKRALPAYPERVVLITSRMAAALQDMLKVFQRTPWLAPRLVHVPVQGVGSAAKIAEALAAVDAKSADLVLLARGGGSLEDLWEFNEEAVARAVRACAVPVVTGIGHEVDVSIADLAADYHAHTPTEAAQVAVAGWRAAADTLGRAAGRLARSLRQTVERQRQRLMLVERHEFIRRPTDRLDRLREGLDDRGRQLRSRLDAAMARVRQRLIADEHRLAGQHPTAAVLRARQRLSRVAEGIAHRQRLRLTEAAGRIDGLRRQLTALDPRGVLARGYSITRRRDGTTVVDPAQVRPGDVLVTQVRGGTIESAVRDSKQLDLFGLFEDSPGMQ